MTIEFTQEIADYICAELANGRSLISICRDEGVPSRDTVNRWIRSNEKFAADIARAREDQADYYLDRQIEYTEIATIEDYPLRKFQADNLKWVAARLRPKKYGDSTTLRGDKDNPLAMATFTLDLGKPSGEADDDTA